MGLAEVGILFFVHEIGGACSDQCPLKDPHIDVARHDASYAKCLQMRVAVRAAVMTNTSQKIMRKILSFFHMPSPYHGLSDGDEFCPDHGPHEIFLGARRTARQPVINDCCDGSRPAKLKTRHQMAQVRGKTHMLEHGDRGNTRDQEISKHLSST